jgi:2',3'-cyclic-nucleotide 2'-phosphodiesterase (5'-nucleotidase family)
MLVVRPTGWTVSYTMAAVSVTYRAAIALALLAACSGAPDRAVDSGPVRPRPRPGTITIAVVGTSDLHGHIEMLPYLAGNLANLRASGRVDDVVLLDAGDMFQGTLESNLNEGKSVVEAYHRLGYAAVAVGNHEYDFGPAGERPVPIEPHDDPRGALKARSAEARYPFLAANLIDGYAREPASWPNLHQSVVIERAGLRIGVIGVSTMDTPRTTNARNFDGLLMAPLAETIGKQAQLLRKRGAEVVLVAAHAGGRCASFENPGDLASCDPQQEIFQVARELAPGTVDAIVAGHTHAGVAHEVNGIPIVQSFSKGIAFGRIDLVIEGGRRRRVISHRIHPPHYLCGERREPPDLIRGESCPAGEYEDKPVVPDRDLTALVAGYEAKARAVRERKLGVVADGVIRGVRSEESPLGNLFADLMRAARPGADVAITNGGGLRADLPKGELTYGDLYEAMPFDNRFATVKLTGAQLAKVFEHNLTVSYGVFSISGVRVAARCSGDQLVLTLIREKGGKKVGPRERLTLVTSDFLASGGDGILGVTDLDQGAIQIHDDGPVIRDGIAEVLARRGGTLRAGDKELFDKAAPRLAYPGKRPVQCGAGK